MNNYNRVYAEVNLDIIRNNVYHIKKYINGAKLLAVVKADAYGHGAVVCAKNIDDIVDFYGVATVDEALDLKTAFVQRPILILGAIFDEKISEAIISEIRITVFNYELAKKLSDYATMMKKKCYIHIKLDTGMNRLGFLNDENLLNTIIKIKNLPNLVIEGIFTHFANADEKDYTRFSNQLDKFNSIINKLSDVGVDIPIIHCANSATINNFRDCAKDMVRAGIILYGYYPTEDMEKNVHIEPALTLKSHIISIKEVDAGEGVSYNSTYITDKKTKIATIPVGYADGYPRSLSNVGYVLVNDKKAKIIGRICMDQFMVDVTDMDVSVNDAVVLIGRDNMNKITLEEVSELSGKFIYELICGLSKRIPRLYFRDNKLIDEINYFYTSRRV